MTENFPLPCSLILTFSQVHYNAVKKNRCFLGGVITKLSDKHTIYRVYEKQH